MPKVNWYHEFRRKIQIPITRRGSRLDFKSLTVSGSGGSTKHKSEMVLGTQEFSPVTPSTAAEVGSGDEENVSVDEQTLIKGCPSLKVMPALSQKNFTPSRSRR